jgi:phosphate/sulfate permease
MPLRPLFEIVFAGSITAIATAADTAVAGNDVSVISSLVEKFGIAFAILIYFIVRDYLRYKEDRERSAAQDLKIEELNKYIREELKGVLERTDNQITADKEAFEKLVEAVKTKNEISQAVEMIQAERNAVAAAKLGHYNHA